MDSYEQTVLAIRRFNRFYTVNMGFLDAGYLDTEYSIAETRILFEMKRSPMCAQSDIVRTLHIDKSYLSRIIARFCKSGLMEKEKSSQDRRMTRLTLTEAGTAETERLIQLTNRRIGDQILQLSQDEREQLCQAMDTVISILGKGDGT